MLEYKKDGWKALLALGPTLILMCIFTFYPIINIFLMVLKQDYNFVDRINPYNGIGFGNFVYIFNDQNFQKALLNTVVMVFISVPITVVVALLLSVALNSIKKFQGFYQTVFFLPYVTNTIALGLVFGVVFHRDYGLFNNLLGIRGTDWLGNTTTYWKAMFVLMVYTLWDGLAFKIIVFLSGLQSIDKQYYQAAQIDGASRSRIFRKITVPLLSPMILYITITSFIGAFKAYNSVIALFGKGANYFGEGNLLITLVGYIYAKLDNNLYGYASAAAIVLFVIILLVTFVQMQVSKKRVHY